jgi:amino-acid N-acetyltransferase
MTGVRIDRARPTDLAAILSLLKAQGLPTDGLEQHLTTTLVAHQDDRLIGSVAVETYPDGGLLRSVAVAGPSQGQGLGQALTSAALEMARDRGLDTLYLLTTTADGYFPKFGFEPITRQDVPASVQTSVEFTSACPSSAVVMRKRL